MGYGKAFAVLAISLLPWASAVAADDVAALIKQQSQEFSDASASGDAAVLGRYLDDNVVFMNESGELATKKDIVDGAAPPAPGTNNTLVQTDFDVKIHGNVAVTSFTDVSTVHFHGQELHAKYRSTEVWKQEGAAWRMISSQTIALQDDPPAAKLPSSLLDQYVGTYQAGPDFRFVIARQGDELTAAANGQKPFVIKAELADVLFTPGQPRTRRIFQRDAAGKITGFVSRREGHDLVLKRVANAGATG
jgi:ketosteroid isomerase-like protein